MTYALSIGTKIIDLKFSRNFALVGMFERLQRQNE